MIDKQQQANADYVKGMKYKDIAEKYGVSINTVKSWKKRYAWERKKGAHKNEKGCTQNKGAPKGNKNATGNSGGSALPGNQNAKKHGLFSKYIPESTREIMDQLENQTPADLIWFQIELQFAAIIRAQEIMYVESKDDKTEEQTASGKGSASWSYQQSWDKQANFMKAQSRAMGELRSLIKQFNDMAHETDERRLKLQAMQTNIEKTNLEIAKLKSEGEEVEVEDDGFVEAMDNAAKAVWGSVSHEEKG